MIHLFVGCLNREAPYFQGARGKGLAVFTLDEDSLDISQVAETGDVDNPTFLTVDARQARVYANSEVFAWREGTVSAYQFDKKAGTLIYLNKQPTLGSITAHSSLSADGRTLLVANYGMGEGGPDRAVAVFGIGADGALTPPSASIRLQGTGPNKERQERSHAHCVLPTPDGELVLIADLGLDKLIAFKPAADGTLAATTELSLPPGSGPRHIAFHPGGKLLFLTNELTSTIASVALGADGEMTLRDVKPAVPAQAQADNHCADIHVAPDGRFVYASNRGHDSIAIFAIDQETGTLTPQGHVASGGATPRNFCLTPSGRHLLVANQNGDSIIIFARDPETGRLLDTDKRIDIGTPVCVRAVNL